MPALIGIKFVKFYQNQLKSLKMAAKRQLLKSENIQFVEKS
jgi:hypothetical protein